MKTETLSATQRDALLRIRVVLDLHTKRTREFLEQNRDLVPANAHPSEWVSVATLTDTYHLPYRTIRALVRKSFLLSRPTDGFGPEVKPAGPEYVP
jgi:hypothetical protein